MTRWTGWKGIAWCREIPATAKIERLPRPVSYAATREEAEADTLRFLREEDPECVLDALVYYTGPEGPDGEDAVESLLQGRPGYHRVEDAGRTPRSRVPLPEGVTLDPREFGGSKEEW